MHCFLDHIAINARDPGALMDFYVHIVGLAPERWQEFEAGTVLFPSARLNKDSILDFFPESMWEHKELPPSPGCANVNHLCLAVTTDEWVVLNSRLSEAGVEIAMGPGRRWGARGDGISIYFNDPEGNLVEVRHYPAAKGEPGPRPGPEATNGLGS